MCEDVGKGNVFWKERVSGVLEKVFDEEEGFKMAEDL